jgi:O-antigen/teichoic acid export membrane protein
MRIARNSVWMVADTIVGMGATLLASMLVGRHLGPDFMGHFNFILTFTAVIRLFTDLAIAVTVRKFAAELMGRGDYVQLKTLLRSAMRLQAVLTAVGVSVGIGIVYGTFERENQTVAMLALLTLIPSLTLSIPTGALWATENLRANVVPSLLATIVNVTGVVLSVLLGWGMIGLICSLLISRTFDCGLRMLLFRRAYARLPGAPSSDGIDAALRARMIPFAALQFVLTMLYWGMADRMEVFFLKRLAESREIAFYSLPFTLVYYLLQFPQQISGATSASMMVKQGVAPEQAAHIAATATWFVMLLAAPLLFGVASLSDPVLRIMYGVRYLPAIPVLTVLALFGLSLAVSAPAQHLMVSAERQVFYILWMCASGAIDVVGCLVLVPYFGAVGAAYAKGVSQVVAAAGFLVFMMRQFQVHLPLLRMLKLLVACTAMFLGVRLFVRLVPAVPAIVLGIPLGVLLFALGTRWLRCLDTADARRLRQLDRLFPGGLRRAYAALVAFLVPTGPAAGPPADATGYGT